MKEMYCGDPSSANGQESQQQLDADGAKRRSAEGPGKQEPAGSSAEMSTVMKTGPARVELHVRFWNLTYTLPSGLHGRPCLSQCCGESAFSPSRLPVDSPSKTRWRTTTRQILQGLSGYFAPGKLVGILGPSGAGKSTFLSILGGRLKSGVRGRIEANGKPLTSRFKKVTGYVTQHEYFYDSLTVEETLDYTASLRLGKSVTRAQKKARVDDVIAAMKLGKCRHTRVGSVYSRGLSGGELKRLNIANELLVRPAFLLLDEPTSGLDASVAADVIDLLKKTTQENRCTTVCTIHQPSSDVFMRFDRVMLLRDGHLVYQGSPSQVGAYFSSLNFHCPEGRNVADYVMQVLTATSSEECRHDEQAATEVPPPLIEEELEAHVENVENQRITGKEMLNHTSRREVIFHTSGAPAASNTWEKFSTAFYQIRLKCCRERRGEGVRWAAGAQVTTGEDVLVDAYKRRLDNTSFEMRLSDRVPHPGNTDSTSTHEDAGKDTICAFPSAQEENSLQKKTQGGLGGLWRRFLCRVLSRDRTCLPFSAEEKEFLDPPGYFHQVWALICRGVTKEIRGKAVPLDLFQGTLTGLLLGNMYFQKLAVYSENGLRERMGLLYFTATHHMYVAAFHAFNAFPVERNVIAKERSSGAYSLSCYLVAKTVIDLVIQAVEPTVCLSLLYPLAGLPGGIQSFLAFWAQLMLLVVVSQAVGLLVAGLLVKDPHLGGPILSVLLMSALLSSGLYMSQHRLAPWTSWIRWLAFPNYCVSNFIHISLGSRTLSCAEFSSFSSCPQNPITAAMIAEEYTTGLSPASNVCIVVLMGVGLKILSYAAMRRSLNLNR